MCIEVVMGWVFVWIGKLHIGGRGEDLFCEG